MTAPFRHVRGRRALPWLLAALVPAVVAALVVPTLGSARTAQAPSATAEPKVSGSTSAGSTLTGTNGEWTGDPTSFKYNWRRCPPDGGQGAGNCDGIVDGPSNTYTLTGHDVGFTIRLEVKAFNADGKGTSTSNATAVVTGTGEGPTNTGLPAITGTAQVGQTLTASEGTWASTFLVDFSYGWLRCDAGGGACTATGATGSTYVVAAADGGSTLRVQVSATNPAGTTQVQSAPTAVVPGGAPPPPPPPPSAPSGQGCPPGRGPVPVSSVTSPARLLIDRQAVSPAVIPRASGRDLSVRYHVSDTCGQSVAGALVYATAVPFGQLSTPAEAATGPTGYVTLRTRTLAGFPLGRAQRSVEMFVRARKPGEDLLAGISARRLFAIRVGR